MDKKYLEERGDKYTAVVEARTEIEGDAMSCRRVQRGSMAMWLFAAAAASNLMSIHEEPLKKCDRPAYYKQHDLKDARYPNTGYTRENYCNQRCSVDPW